MLDQAREVIKEVLQNLQSPIVACSFGKESVLLLHLVREQKSDIPVLWLRDNLLRSQRGFAERLVVEWDLTVFGIAPVDQYLVPSPDGRLSFISEYNFNGELFPIVQDLVEGDRCLLKLPQYRALSIEFPFDAVFIGWKDSDEHPIFDRIPYPPDGAQARRARFYAPLRYLSDDQVWQATKDLNIPYNKAKYDEGRNDADPDCVIACARCLEGQGKVFCPDVGQEIDSHSWNRDASLKAFRGRFGL